MKFIHKIWAALALSIGLSVIIMAVPWDRPQNPKPNALNYIAWSWEMIKVDSALRTIHRRLDKEDISPIAQYRQRLNWITDEVNCSDWAIAFQAMYGYGASIVVSEEIHHCWIKIGNDYFDPQYKNWREAQERAPDKKLIDVRDKVLSNLQLSYHDRNAVKKIILEGRL